MANYWAAKPLTRYFARMKGLVTATIAALLLPLTVTSAAAQLRPLEPFEWRALDRAARASAIHVEVGGALLTGQRAALAGTEGRLIEAGNFRILWRTGPVVLEAGGTVQRFFRDDVRFAPPSPEVDAGHTGSRADPGDYRFATTVRLTSRGEPLTAMLRFGTRLPTTDDRTGLDRDMTDFFGLIGGSYRRGALLVGAETGVSINGTRDPEFGQKDVMPYMLVAEWMTGGVQPRVSVVGDLLGPSRELRGNEPHGEVRIGVRAGGRVWLRAEGVRGYRAFSPGWGAIVAVGWSW